MKWCDCLVFNRALFIRETTRQRTQLWGCFGKPFMHFPWKRRRNFSVSIFQWCGVSPEIEDLGGSICRAPGWWHIALSAGRWPSTNGLLSYLMVTQSFLLTWFCSPVFTFTLKSLGWCLQCKIHVSVSEGSAGSICSHCPVVRSQQSPVPIPDLVPPSASWAYGRCSSFSRGSGTAEKLVCNVAGKWDHVLVWLGSRYLSSWWWSACASVVGGVLGRGNPLQKWPWEVCVCVCCFRPPTDLCCCVAVILFGDKRGDKKK